MAEARVEEFISANKGLDAQAADALRSTSREVQNAVLERGAVTGRNRSVVLIRRIRQAEEALMESSNLEGQLEQLCATVDSHAGSALKGSTREVQRAVLTSASSRVQKAVVAQGSLAGAKNPSAKLIARVREAEDSLDMPDDIAGRIEYLTSTPGVDTA